MTNSDQLASATQADRVLLQSAPVIRRALAGNVTRELYLAFLAQAYHHVRHTVPLLMGVGVRLTARHHWLQKKLVHYLEEEVGHDEWILNDIDAAGGDANQVRESAPAVETDAMVAYAYDTVMRRQPTGFFGMVFVLEGTSVALALHAASSIQHALALPDRAFSYLRSHGTLDRNHPDRAEPLVWQGIVLSTYAGVKGGLGALSLAKESRDSLLAAVKLNGDVLNGSAYTSLGALYYKVPRWPVGFADHDKAAEYLRKALALNPDGIDPNYFYGELMFEEGDYAQALRYLRKAVAAPLRPERPLADSGRRGEINALIARARAKQG